MKRSNRIICLCLIFVLLFSSSFVIPGMADNAPAPAAGTSAASGGMEPICCKGELSLMASLTTGEFAVKNTATGQVWYSNPPDRAADPYSGSDRNKTYSQLVLQYIEDQTMIHGFVTGYEAQENGGVTVKKKKDGFSVFYKFFDLKIAVPMEITLTEKGIIAEVNVKGIREDADKKLLNIAVLPYFGAAGVKDEGYMVVPDGCGALISFNSGRQDLASYNEPIYGRDLTLAGDTKTKQQEVSALPLFGLKKGNQGFAAIITAGDATASVVAGISKKGSGYNNIYADFTLRSEGSVKISGNSMNVYEQNAPRVKTCRVEYRLLTGENTDYTGIAKSYSEYLLEKGVTPKEKKNLSMLIEAYGAVRVDRSVLGIPAKVVQPLTTFAQAGDMAEELKENGVEGITLLCNDFDRDSLFARLVKSVRPERKLGGARGLKKLNRRLDSLGVSHVSVVDLTTYQNGSGKNKKSALGLGGLPGVTYWFDLGTNRPDDSVKPYYHLAPELLQKNAERFAGKYNAEKYGGIALENFAEILYSDFSKSRPCGRQQAMNFFRKAAKTLSGKNSLYVKGGAAWSLEYADYIYDMPSDTSRSDLEDRPIPLFQLAVSGIVPYSLTAVNRSVDPDSTVLKCAEYGGDLKYDFTWDSFGVVGESELSYLNGTWYRQWKDHAADSYRKLAGISDVICGKMLCHKQVQSNVFVTTYEGGSVAVNYNEKEVTVGNQTVGARDFILLKEGD